MLTHYNIASNIEQMGQTFMLDRKRLPARRAAVFPFLRFHGDALAARRARRRRGLSSQPARSHRRRASWSATIASRFCSPRPRSCKPICAAARRKISAACNLWWWARRNCRSGWRVAFEDRFGIRPLEGYGATECSPVVAVNTRDFRAPGFRQVGAKRGRIGHPLPGISVRIVDPDTREPLPVGTPGLLLVRGPNVMKGYLGKPEKTAEVLRDGWYVTGDIAARTRTASSQSPTA